MSEDVVAHGSQVHGGWWCGFLTGQDGTLWQCDHKHERLISARACAAKAENDAAYREAHDLDAKVRA